jgi:hypothetical protein
MLKRKRKNPIVEEVERKAEIMEYVILENRKKRQEEDQILSDICKSKEQFKQKMEPIYHAKLNLMTIEELQSLTSECLSSVIRYFRSLSDYLIREELVIGLRTLGNMLSDLTKVLETPINKSSGEQLQKNLLQILQFLYVYEKFQQSYLAVDFYSIKHKFPRDFFIEKKKEYVRDENHTAD